VWQLGLDETVRMGSSARQDIVIADTHNDLLMLVVRRPPDKWGTYFGERWVPQLRAGGVGVQVLPVFIDTVYRPEGALRESLRMIEAAHRAAEANSDDVALCLTGAEVESTVASGRIALVLALEGCPQIDTDVELLQTLARLGVRMASFTHFGRSALADGSAEDATGSRLTRAGVEALALVEEIGVMFDVSHLGHSGVDHVLELATRPVIASHSSARALRDHHRNLTDAHLEAIGRGGGVVCVNFFPGFLAASGATVDTIADHVEHVASVAGIDHVGIGPDFLKELMDELEPGDHPVFDVDDGLDARAVVPGLTGPADLPLITAALRRRGMSDEEVSAVLGGNVLRLFRVELGRRRDDRDGALG
jgi:membrane dipeptidase